MNVRLPPLKSVEAFVVAAQFLSFTKAASVLHITVPAVSRRIQALEVELGAPLFQRMHRALKLTSTGELYLQKLAPAIESIRQASATVRGTPRRKAVKVSVISSFAANWLVPRLSRFYAQHHSVQIEFETSNDYVNFGESDVDVAIRLGTGNWAGVHTERLLDLTAYPVCTSGYAKSKHLPCALSDLVRAPLLGLTPQPELWPNWLKMAGIVPPDDLRVIEFDSFHLLYEAAANGLGLAMGVDVIVQPFLQSGRLIAPFDIKYNFSKKFYLVSPTRDYKRPPVRAFCEWLKAEAELWRDNQSSVIAKPIPLRQRPAV
jgi:LysR family transcriptional regulator, glycine cleavage system transcriptional activator